jgi:lipoprotein signal peptidase
VTLKPFTRIKSSFVSLVPFFSLLIVDQVLKHRSLESGSVYINTGISFGWLEGWKQLPLLGIIVATFIASLIIIFNQKSPTTPIFKQPSFSPLPHLAWGLILAGIISNLIDRLFYPGVVDYLSYPVFNLHNNLADWGIFLGIIMLIFKYVRSSHPNQSPPAK